MGFWKNLWKAAKWLGKHAPEIIAVVDKIRDKKKDG